jgi:hypothetical protein
MPVGKVNSVKSRDAMPVSWNAVQARWDAAVVAADHAMTTPAVRLKPVFPLSLRRSTVPVAITGQRGNGKSVLYDGLLGKISTTYVLPARSDDAESYRVILDNGDSRTRCGIVVVPGQESRQRRDALDRMFRGGAFPTGVIHVVSFGHDKVWDAEDLRAIGEDLRATTPDFGVGTIRKQHIVDEMTDFESMCSLLRSAWERESRVWLIIAVAKTDLYWPLLDSARRYYLPQDGVAVSPFTRELRTLVERVGYDKFTDLAVLPVSCYPSRHEFDPTLPLQAPTRDFQQATALINQFRTVLGEFCERQ